MLGCKRKLVQLIAGVFWFQYWECKCLTADRDFLEALPLGIQTAETASKGTSWYFEFHAACHPAIERFHCGCSALTSRALISRACAAHLCRTNFVHANTSGCPARCLFMIERIPRSFELLIGTWMCRIWSRQKHLAGTRRLEALAQTGTVYST
ncbi:hypothetical protein VTK56DRAFT_396 [Thermocarpiscus australiensis]